jgi:hypothetical protein
MSVIKIGEVRGELVSIGTSKAKDQERVTRALVEITSLQSRTDTQVSKSIVAIPIDFDTFDELREHVGRRVRVSFEVFPAKDGG